MKRYFQNLFRAMAGEPVRDPLDDFWYSPIGAVMLSSAGAAVTPETALRVPTVVDCLQALAQPIASLPLGLFRRLENGDKERVTDHWLYRVLHTQPGDEQTDYEFRGQMQWNLALHNNAYAEIIPGGDGSIARLSLVHPNYVQRIERRSDAIWYSFLDPVTNRTRQLRRDQVWHLKGLPLTPDGLRGADRLDHGREAIGAALALQAYAGRYFKNDGQAGGIIKHKGRFAKDEDKSKFMEQWRLARTGANAHRDVLLEFGMDYDRAVVNNVHAQFVELRKELKIEIAQLWRMPPHKIGLLDRATFSNIEQQSIEFVTDTLLPWLVLWERAISRDLILGDEPLFAEFNVAGLLRGDTLARYQAYAIGRNWGWLSANDVRRLENMNSIGEEGDRYLQPTNMQPADAPAEPSQQNRPRQGAANIVELANARS